jgi:hypothetical protein
MVVTLEKLGLIDRVLGQPRTIEVLLSREELPDLDNCPSTLVSPLF